MRKFWNFYGKHTKAVEIVALSVACVAIAALYIVLPTMLNRLFDFIGL